MIREVLLGAVLLAACETVRPIGTTVSNVYVDGDGRVTAVERCELMQHDLGRKSWVSQGDCRTDRAELAVPAASPTFPAAEPWLRYAVARQVVFVIEAVQRPMEWPPETQRLRIVERAGAGSDTPFRLAPNERLLTPEACARDSTCNALATADWNRRPWWELGAK